MSPQQALSVLLEATEAINATRKQHALIVQALETIKAAIQLPLPKEESDERKQS